MCVCTRACVPTSDGVMDILVLVTGSNPAPKDTDNIEDWEAALQDELDQMTLEGDGDVLPEDTEGWEKELEQLLEAKS